MTLAAPSTLARRQLLTRQPPTAFIALLALLALLLNALTACSGHPTSHVGAAKPTTPSSSPPPVTATVAVTASPSPGLLSVPAGPASEPGAEATSIPGAGVITLPNAVGSPLIVLNPGHNGGDFRNLAALQRQVPAGFGLSKDCETTGTDTNTGYPEHEFNFDVSTRVASALQAHGVRVQTTRADDNSFGPCVDARAALGNDPEVAAVISIHADGAPLSGHGFHVCQDSRQPAGPAVAAQSNALTTALHNSLLAGSGMTISSYLGRNGYYPRDDLAALNLATRPATFLEIGNMRNAGDAAIQTSAAGRERIAEAVAAGILAYLSGS